MNPHTQHLHLNHKPQQCLLVVLVLLVLPLITAAPGWGQATGLCTLACKPASAPIVKATPGATLIGQSDGTWAQGSGAPRWITSAPASILASGTTRTYWSFNFFPSTDEEEAQYRAPSAGTVGSVTCLCTKCPGASETITFSFRINGAAASGLGTCGIVGASCPATCSMSGSASISAGDRIDWSQIHSIVGTDAVCSCSGLLS